MIALPLRDELTGLLVIGNSRWTEFLVPAVVPNKNPN